MIANDKKIAITIGENRKSTNWKRQELMWSDFINKISSPVVTTETFEQFLKLKKSEQDELKDVGGFIGGTLKGNRRKAENVISRCLVTLDADSIEAGKTSDILKIVDSLGCGYAVYSTRKHCAAKPRLRILIPLDRDVKPDEYEAISRKLASFISIQIMDPSTFEASRLMYWPSCSKDSEYVFKYADKAFASADGLLKMYTNWKDVNEWPKVVNETEIVKHEIQKQKDPIAKENIVGAFCKAYNIYDCIATFLSDVYEQGNSADKYTYIKGSVANGATVYEDGKWLYSFHATDPASRILCNSFDLVRIHMFGELDDDVKPGTPANKLPSYIEMCKFALEDEKASGLYKKEKYDRAIQDFKTEEKIEQKEAKTWIEKLKYSVNGGLAKLASNILLILENDENLKGSLVFDRFTGRFLITQALPWHNKKKFTQKMWSDEDEACLRNYFDTVYGLKAPSLIRDALCELKMRKSTHAVQEYFKSLKWDNTPRIDTLLVDYLGAEDNEYTRAVIRKELVAAVARVITEMPIKFDNMIILTGPQGIGKSTFLAKLGKEWFTDNIIDFNNKDTLLIMQKCLIIEVPELQGFNKADSNRLKQFMSLQTDTFRAPYDREAKEYHRHCVFFGTTNDDEFLKDKTGNRRFWPVECHKNKPTKSIFKDLTPYEIDQIWAETIEIYKMGEPLFLEDESEKIAKMKQGLHQESHPWEGPIREFITKKVSKNWLSVGISERAFFNEGTTENVTDRDRICATEIWCECLGNSIKNIKVSDTKVINGILSNLEFEDRKLEKEHLYFGKEYGKQRGFKIHYTATSATL